MPFWYKNNVTLMSDDRRHVEVGLHQSHIRRSWNQNRWYANCFAHYTCCLPSARSLCSSDFSTAVAQPQGKL